MTQPDAAYQYLVGRSFDTSLSLDPFCPDYNYQVVRNYEKFLIDNKHLVSEDLPPSMMALAHFVKNYGSGARGTPGERGSVLIFDHPHDLIKFVLTYS